MPSHPEPAAEAARITAERPADAHKFKPSPELEAMRRRILANFRPTERAEEAGIGPRVPMYFFLGHAEQPSIEKTSDSERYVLQMIHSGRLLVSTWFAFAATWSDRQIGQIMTPAWDEPETYYDVITDVLQAADHAGFDVERLCQQAISNQSGLKREGQDKADRLRGGDCR